MEWPPDINNGINWSSNPNGNLTNSDLKFSGLLLLFMIMKNVCKFLSSKHVVLFSNDQPAVHWVHQLSAKSSVVDGKLTRALALRLKFKGVSPLTPIHVAGDKNSTTYIPSRSFVSETKRHCKNDTDLLHLFN